MKSLQGQILACAGLAILGAAAFADDGRAGPGLAPVVQGEANVLVDSAALRATVYGTPPQDMAPMPAKVPLVEINMTMPWALPQPGVVWFDRRLRVWFSAQDKAAPLAIVIAGTGGDGNTALLSTLRGALYGAGYHVLTMPSPTFPGFIVSTSSTGVAGDLTQDGQDLYAAMQRVVAHLPRKVRITDIDVLGYSLGGANAAIVKSIDAREHKLNIHRAVMIEPPVSLFASVSRLDRMFALSIGAGDEDLERLYHKLYAQLANLYRASDRVQIDENFLLGAAAVVLRTDAEFSAAIALTFRLALLDMFFVGDLYAGTGVVIDPMHPPQPRDSLEEIYRSLRKKPFTEYFSKVFLPYYLKRRPHATRDSLIADNGLNVIGDALRNDPDYYVQANSDDLIIDEAELNWLKTTLGPKIAVYDHGGHLGNVGDRGQVSDMLDMLAGRWQGATR
ncbi:MAG: alpha/beta fold hydrolase [Pseudomonadota bacterium]|nr:alpha/beta fold hydrolase [Pseudomonadota bacterium]